MQLEGKVAIITGAGTGLGKLAAVRFAREGAKVASIGRRPEKLEETRQDVEAVGGEFLAYRGDMSVPEEVDGLVQQTADRFGSLDIVINNAGIHAKPAIAHEVAIEDFDAFISINLRGPFMLMRAAIPHMLKAGGGSIINIASTVGVVGVKYCTAYGTAKGGMLNMTRTVAMDYADKGIRVNCVATGGMTKTENTRLLSDREVDMIREGYPPAPTGMLSDPEDVSELLVFLAGPRSTNVTGETINFNGGETAR